MGRRLRAGPLILRLFGRTTKGALFEVRGLPPPLLEKVEGWGALVGGLVRGGPPAGSIAADWK